ncbi:MAG: TlpA family protein disulfide reductase, partial [Opitutae bacterium]|nr:TlpA family protein disulfide reductase [Opitutae bacterium]
MTGPKGETIRRSDFAGKILIVDVSATWCGPCQAAMPNNDRIYRKYADQGVVLLGVTADDSREAYDGWIKRSEGKYRFTMAFDPAGRAGWDESVFNTKYHVSGFPTMFVVGRDGKIVETVSGGGPGEDYRLEYALARAGAKVDLASIPPEPKKDPNAPRFIAASAKTAAMPASTGMIGMGAPAPAAGGGFTPEKFGSIARGAVVPDVTVTGADGSPVKLSSFRGKTLLVQFCTGTGPQPWFAKIAQSYKDQALNVLAVFSAADKADFDQWVAANPNPGFAVAWDPAGKAWAENVTNTLFGVGMYPATAVLKADGTLWSGTIGMGDKVVAMVYSMLARNGVKLTTEHMDALVAAGGAFKMGGSPAAATAGAAAEPAPKAPFGEKYGKLKAGDPMPDFTVRTVDGQEARFSELAKGKTVVLDFWATWCGPCQQAMPHYEEMHRKYAGQGVLFLGICCFDQREAYDKWVAANQDKYTFTTVFDPVGKPASGDKEAMQKTIMMQVSGGALTPLPTTLVINAAGKFVGNYAGYGPGTHAALANLLMITGVELAAEDKPKTFFPAGSTARPAGAAMAAAT